MTVVITVVLGVVSFLLGVWFFEWLAGEITKRNLRGD